MNQGKAVNHGEHGAHGEKSGMQGRQPFIELPNYLRLREVLPFSECAVLAVVKKRF
jgi:hypothetical protein